MQQVVAIAVLNNMHGYVMFTDTPRYGGADVEFKLQGFEAGKTHAIHLHELGDLSRGCDSLGGHYNPAHVTHGSASFAATPRHAGDLINNFTADRNGRFAYKYHDSMISVQHILGRSIVVHAGTDDLGRGGSPDSLTTGNAGARIACGVVGRVS